MKNKKFYLAICIILNSIFLFAEVNQLIIDSSKLMEIPRLSSYEVTFKEYSKIIENNFKEISAGRTPEFLFFKYKNTENFTLQGLAARCSINYDTIATLNQIESSSTSIKDKTLILPTVQGLFINSNQGKNQIEVLLKENTKNQNLTKEYIYCKIDSEEYYFLQGKRFSPTERAYFVDTALGLPLSSESFWVSSEFGKRKNPFSGEFKNHNGVDLAADEGTPVYAIKDGAVALTIANDPDFGNYIILQHDTGKTTSVYAHLSEIFVNQYANVRKGDVIGLVGKTGKVTGPHLHFEIRNGGKAEDPRNKLKLD